jgi:hypothetical protein
VNDWDIIGQITKLGEGFVLVMHGRSYACRDAKELGAKAARTANRRPKTPFGAKTAEPIQSGFDAMQLDEARLLHADAERAARHSVTQAAERAEKYRVQTDNLYRLVAARFDGNLDPEDLESAFAEMCPDLHVTDLLNVVQEFEDRLFQQAVPDPNAENALGPDCACPGCKMNVSTPNARGMCRGCYAGEHAHPTNGQGPVIVPKTEPEDAPWWLEPDDGEDENTGVQSGSETLSPTDNLVGESPGDDATRSDIYRPGNDEPTPPDEPTGPVVGRQGHRGRR